MANDVKMMHIEEDIKKIQIKTNMYMKAYGPKGALHLVEEVVQNCVDELLDPDSEGTRINVIYDRKDDSLTAEDDGRGFPETDFPLEIFCTTLQSGSKFMRDGNIRTAGEFGVGLTAVNALSDTFTIISYREAEGYQHKLVFERGDKILDEKTPLEKGGKKHGSYIKFSPSQKFLGPTTRIPEDGLEEALDNKAFQLPEHATIHYTLMDGFEVIKEKTIKKRDEIHLIDKIVSVGQVLFKPTVISAHSEFVETIPNLDPNIKGDTVDKMRTADYSMIIAYDGIADPVFDSFCNFVNTTEGGVHVKAAEAAFCRYIQNQTKDSLNAREKDKLDIQWSDIRDGLKMVVTLSTNANVEFVGNAKEQIASQLLLKVMTDGFTSALKEYFDSNPEKLSAIIKIVKMSAKVRVESNKLREASTKNAMNSLKEHQMKGFLKCSNSGRQYKEIYLLEGLSPQGGAGNARDTHTQALLAFRGVTANPFKKTLPELMHPQTGNVELRRMVDVLRCGIGPTFDINKLYYDKIILMTDADIDGAGISASLAAFFLRYMPEVVRAGRLYKVVPPLYKIDDKEHPYVHTKKEKVEVYQEKVIKNFKIVILKFGTEYVDKDEFREFIYDTRDYLTNLNRIAEHFKVNKFLIEKTIGFIFYKFGKVDVDFDLGKALSDQSVIAELMSYIQEDFPEITMSGATIKILKGVVDGRFQSIAIGPRFLVKCSTLFPVISKYGYGMVVKEKDDDPIQMSVGRFLELITKYIPKTLVRYKGIGEMAAEDLKDTAMNPNTRMLIRLTIRDLEKDLKVFQKLFGEGKNDALLRKKMMEEYIIDRDDLDN